MSGITNPYSVFRFTGDYQIHNDNTQPLSDGMMSEYAPGPMSPLPPDEMMGEHSIITNQIRKISSIAREQFIEIRTAIIQGTNPDYNVLNNCSDDLIRLIYLVVPSEKREGLGITYFHEMIPYEITETPTENELARCQSYYEEIQEFISNPMG